MRCDAQVTTYGRHGTLRARRPPVVALESTIIAHGLPRPRNVEVAAEIEQTVRADGAVPATIGMIGGAARGRPGRGTRSSTSPPPTTWPSSRSAISPWPLRPGADGATTVASTAALAARAGIAVFATGGPRRGAPGGAARPTTSRPT